MKNKHRKFKNDQQTYIPVKNEKAVYKGDEELPNSVKAEIEIKQLQVSLLEWQVLHPESYAEFVANEMKLTLIHSELLPETAKSDEKIDKIIKDFTKNMAKIKSPTCEEVKEQIVNMFLEIGVDKNKMIERYPWGKEYLQDATDVQINQNSVKNKWENAIEEALQATEVPEPEFEMEM